MPFSRSSFIARQQADAEVAEADVAVLVGGVGDAEAAFVDDGGVDGEGVEGQGVHFLRNLRVDEVGNVVAVAVVELNGGRRSGCRAQR